MFDSEDHVVVTCHQSPWKHSSSSHLAIHSQVTLLANTLDTMVASPVRFRLCEGLSPARCYFLISSAHKVLYFMFAPFVFSMVNGTQASDCVRSLCAPCLVVKMAAALCWALTWQTVDHTAVSVCFHLYDLSTPVFDILLIKTTWNDICREVILWTRSFHFTSPALKGEKNDSHQCVCLFLILI